MDDGPVLIRTQAARLGLNQRAIASVIGVSAQAVNKWWHGEAEPSREVVGAIEELLQIPRGDLSLAFKQLPGGTAEIVERDETGRLLVRVSGSPIPGYLNGTEPLFDPESLSEAA